MAYNQGRPVLATAFFDGQPTRQLMQSFSSSRGESDSRDAFLQQLHDDRLKRESERKRTHAAAKIQVFWRREKCRREVVRLQIFLYLEIGLHALFFRNISCEKLLTPILARTKLNRE